MITSPGLQFTWIWDDDDLVELRGDVRADPFQGRGTAYATRADLVALADQLSVFSRTLEGRVSFQTGFNDGTKAICLECYTIDRARHVAAHVRIVSDAAPRPEGIARLEVEFPIEPTALDSFIRELRSMKDIGDHALLRAAGRS